MVRINMLCQRILGALISSYYIVRVPRCSACLILGLRIEM